MEEQQAANEPEMRVHGRSATPMVLIHRRLRSYARPLATLVLLAVAVLGSACSSQVPTCRSGQLQLAVGGRVNPTTGENPLPLIVINASDTSCALVGYPRVSLLDGSGSELPFGVRRLSATSHPPVAVDVNPGGAAYVLIDKYRCDKAAVGVATAVTLIPPTDDTPLQTGLKGAPIAPLYCGPGEPGSFLDVGWFTARPVANSYGLLLGGGDR